MGADIIDPAIINRMEQPCHNCGRPVEEGVAFCPACNAPQIRVAGLRPEAFSEAAPPLPATGPLTPAEAPRPRVDWGEGLRAAAVSGVLVGLASFLPLSYGIWVLLGGALAVALYRRSRPQAGVTAGMGARLGALTGVLGFATFALISALLILARGEGGRIRQALQQAVQQAAAENASDPRAQEAMELLTTPAGLTMMMVVVALVFLAFFVLFSALGGALGAWAMGKRRPS